VRACDEAENARFDDENGERFGDEENERFDYSVILDGLGYSLVTD
jgi:hypothetical protein